MVEGWRCRLGGGGVGGGVERGISGGGEGRVCWGGGGWKERGGA